MKGKQLISVLVVLGLAFTVSACRYDSRYAKRQRIAVQKQDIRENQQEIREDRAEMRETKACPTKKHHKVKKVKARKKVMKQVEHPAEDRKDNV